MLTYIKRHFILVGAILLIVILTATGVIFKKKTQTSEGVVDVVRAVKTVSARDFRSDTRGVSATGVVESLEQAEIRSQFSAPVVKIYVAIGDVVKRGDVIITLQNSDVSAQLNQALAAVAVQESRLEELKKGPREEDIKISENDVMQAEQAYMNTLTNTMTAITTALVVNEDAAKTQADPLFSESDNGKLIFQPNDTQTQIDAETGRFATKEELAMWRTEIVSAGKNPDEATVLSLLSKSKAHIIVEKNFLGRLADALNATYTSASLSQATLSGYKSGVNLARTNVNNAFNTLNASEQGIASAKISLQKAKDILALKKAGYSNEQISAQEAALNQARASVEGLRAQYAKTVIAAPIDGSIASLPVRVGELINIGQLVTSIVNTKGLQIKAYVSESDFKRIEDGADVRIEETIKGRLMKVAPSLDAQTKKIEVKVLVIDGNDKKLIVGQDAKLSIPIKADVNDISPYFLPIQNVKIIPGDAYVYTVSASSTIQAHSVVLGEVRGDFIEIVSGITDDMEVVSPVYDLKEGDIVRVE